MVGKIKSKNDLPEWFDIRRYQQQEELNEAELSYECCIRVMIINWLEKYDRPNSDLDNSWLCIKENALLTLNSDINSQGENASFMSEDHNKLVNVMDEVTRNTLFSDGRVSPISLYDAFIMGEDAKKEMGITELETSTDVLINKPLYKILGSYDLSCGDKINLQLSVNLKYTDQQLSSALLDILPQCREKLGVSEPDSVFKNIYASRIVSNQLLPLIDLHIWASIEKKTIANSVLAVTLFPDGTKGEEEIRKTILPLMKRVFTFQFIEDWRIECGYPSSVGRGMFRD